MTLVDSAAFGVAGMVRDCAGRALRCVCALSAQDISAAAERPSFRSGAALRSQAGCSGCCTVAGARCSACLRRCSAAGAAGRADAGEILVDAGAARRCVRVTVSGAAQRWRWCAQVEAGGRRAIVTSTSWPMPQIAGNCAGAGRSRDVLIVEGPAIFERSAAAGADDACRPRPRRGSSRSALMIAGGAGPVPAPDRARRVPAGSGRSSVQECAWISLRAGCRGNDADAARHRRRLRLTASSNRPSAARRLRSDSNSRSSAPSPAGSM